MQGRDAPLEMTPDEFRQVGHTLIDRIADLLASLPRRPVTAGESPSALRALLGDSELPEQGEDASRLLEHTAELLFDHSLFNGHPRFWGYITSSAAPIGVLGDLLAAAVNPNVGAWTLSPAASEIEAQTVRWIAQLIGYPTSGDGILVSGGNMANFVCLLAARRARANWNIREAGMAAPDARRLRIYASTETHTWIQKAADLFGFGARSICWVPTDSELRLDVAALRAEIQQDRASGEQPFLVIGTAGSVATGAIDPLPELAQICREEGLWFHVDGAYGAFAAALPDAPAALRGIGEADSVAVDPHKWLYAPLEAGCALVRDPQALVAAFSYHPSYYRFEESGGERAPANYYERGLQNSRGFRALKVWLGLRHAGRAGYQRLIADDIALAAQLYHLAAAHPELQALTHNLSITTFRYAPMELRSDEPGAEGYLNQLNTELLAKLQAGGEAFVSNAVVGGKFALRACVVNFRTTSADIAALPDLVVRLGQEVLTTHNSQLTTETRRSSLT